MVSQIFFHGIPQMAVQNLFSHAGTVGTQDPEEQFEEWMDVIREHNSIADDDPTREDEGFKGRRRRKKRKK